MGIRFRLKSLGMALLPRVLAVLILCTQTGCAGWGGSTETGKQGGAGGQPIPADTEISSPLLGKYRFTAPPTPTPSGTLIFTSTQFPSVANPLFAASDADLAIDAALWGQPVVYDEQFHVHPDQLLEVPLAENGGVQDQGKTIVMHLRHDLRWSDGQPIVADDFLYWWQLNQDSMTGATITAGYDQIASIETPDQFTVILHMKRAFGPYLSYLPLAAPRHAWGHFQPIDLQNTPSVYLTPQVTSGPYRMVSKEPGRYSLAPHPYYTSTTFHGPFASELVYQGSSGVVDMVENVQQGKSDITQGYTEADLPLLAHLPADTRVLAEPASAYEHLDFNLAHPMLQDERVRRAIELAIDVCGLLKRVLHAPDCARRVGQVEPLPSLFFDPSIALSVYDPHKAAELLSEAGWSPDSGGIRTKNGQQLRLLLVTTHNDPVRKVVAEAIQRSLQTVGVQIEVAYFDRDAFFGGYTTGGILATGAFDLALFTYANSPEPDDQYGVFHSSQIPDAAHPDLSNYGRVNDPLLDQALTQGRETVDFAGRVAAYHRLLERLAAQVYVIPLFVDLNIVTVRARVQNVTLNPNKPLNSWNSADWWLSH